MNIHEHVLKNKVEKTNDKDLIDCLKEYKKFKSKLSELKITDKKSVFQFVAHFNDYRNICAYKYERRKNSGQELLRSTMLEGFFQLLFKDLVLSEEQQNQKLTIGHANVLSSFTFSPFSYLDSFKRINFATQMKDQDFVIGIESEIIIKHNNIEENQKFTIPFIIIECKTYIEKNMLETHINSSTETKKIFPFCLYFIASEYMKMKTGSPARSALDEVYILCKEKNSVRENKLKQNIAIDPIEPNLVYDLFSSVQRHLSKNFWDKESPFNNGTLLNNDC